MDITETRSKKKSLNGKCSTQEALQRTEKLKKIKKSIEEGGYKVNAELIAEKIIEGTIFGKKSR